MRLNPNQELQDESNKILEEFPILALPARCSRVTFSFNCFYFGYPSSSSTSSSTPILLGLLCARANNRILSVPNNCRPLSPPLPTRPTNRHNFLSASSSNSSKNTTTIRWQWQR